MNSTYGKSMKELLFKRKSKFWLYFLACFFPTISDILRILVMGLLFNAIEIKTLDNFYKVSFFIVCYIVIAFILYISSRLLRISYMRDTILDVRIAAFDKIFQTSYKNFSKVSKDVYISNLINDVNDFEKNFFINLLNFIYSSGLYVASAIIIAIIDYKIMLIVVSVSLLLYLIAKLSRKKTESLQKKVSSGNEEFTLNISNTLNGLEILKLNNIEDKFLINNLNSINKIEKAKYNFRIFTESQVTLANMISFLTVMGLLVYLLFQIKNGYNYGDISIIVMLSGNMTFALQNIFPRLNVVRSSASIYHKITKYQKDESTILKKTGFSFTNEIEVNNLSFNHDGKVIFNHANCKIIKGKKYLIKGSSGAGKSTFIKLLTQTYDDYEGSILIDGVDLKTINEKSYANNVSFIFQDVFLFADTLRNNITLYKNYDLTSIQEAVKKAGLEEFVNNKPDGLDEILSENGKNLSGGERQRVSIARAIVKNAQILFIDEGTSALNEELGAKIEKAFLEFNGTVLSISHRTYPNITDKYDYVLEIKNGKINTFTASEYFEEEKLYV